MDTAHNATARRLLLLLDAFIIVLSMVAAYWLHTLLLDAVPLLKVPPRLRELAVLAYLALPVWLLLVLVFQLDQVVQRPITCTELALELIKMHVAGVVVLSVILFLTQVTINRGIVGLFLANSFVFLFLERVMVTAWLRHLHRTGQGQWRLLLVGDDAQGMLELAKNAAADPFPPRIIGYASTGANDPPALDEIPCLGRALALEEILHREAVDEVLFFAPFDRPERVGEALRILDGLGVPASIYVRRYEPFEAPPRVRFLYGQPFLTFERAPKPLQAVVFKHALDLIVAAALVIFLLPVFLVAALAIWVTMGRPIFFSQERAGLYGRKFRMLKFRTMCPDAEGKRDELLALNEMGGPVFKITDDPRVTPLGRFLRKWSIDELPQLFNVLTGSMSLVGPRPLPIREQEDIRGWHRRRLSMKPGITGLWQVSGRSDLSFDEWMKLDLRYVDEWSLHLDLLILLKTIPAVLLRRGSR